MKKTLVAATLAAALMCGTAYAQQITVKIHVPGPVEAYFLERGIESDTMSITFGISQRAIHVKQDGAQGLISIIHTQPHL